MSSYAKYFMAVLVIPIFFISPLYEASAQEVILCASTGRSAKLTYRGGEPGSCGRGEMEVAVSVGPAGPPGPSGNDGDMGDPGNDGADVTNICAGEEMLLADGTCLDLAALLPNLCPCFDASAIMGRGIDYNVEILSDIDCSPTAGLFGAQLTGTRAGGDGWMASAELNEDLVSGSCMLIDGEDVSNVQTNTLNLVETLFCIELIQQSQMVVANCSLAP